MDRFSDRRKFLRQSLYSGAVLGLSSAVSSCAALDRLFLGQSSDLSEKTVILGGGLAGLSAAYELRKQGKPYRIFEGNSRVGGRSYTLQGLTPAGQSAELGFEWFASEDKIFWQLAKELKLDIIEISEQRKNLRILGNLNKGNDSVPFPEKEIRDLQKAARRLEKLSQESSRLYREKPAWRESFLAQKEISVTKWATQVSRDRDWLKLVEVWSQFRFGVSSELIPAIVFVNSFIFSESSNDPWAANRYKFRGGSQALVEALLDRVMGVIPGDRLLMSHRLYQIDRYKDGYELSFETPDGRRRYFCKSVICALPWAVLKDIDGIDLVLSSDLIKNPRVSNQTKAAMVFRERFWRQNWNQGRVLSNPIIYESTFKQNSWLENSWGILSGIWTFDKPGMGGPHLIRDWITKEQQVMDRHDLPLVESAVQDWTKISWSKGSRSYPYLGMTDRTFRIKTSEVSKNQNWFWAGEHVSVDSEENIGTAAAALTSGRFSAQLAGQNLAIEKDHSVLFR